MDREEFREDKLKERSCKYRCGSITDLRLIYLPTDKGWDGPYWVCRECRNYLRGNYKYISDKEVENNGR